MKNLQRSNLPPIPPTDTPLSEVCSVVNLYLAVWNDLTAEQQQFVSAHTKICAYCANEEQKMRKVTQLLQRSPVTYPSERVDQAVMTAIHTRAKKGIIQTPKIIHPPFRTQGYGAASSLRIVSIVAVAAVVLFAVVATLRLVKQSSSPEQAFLLPTTLTWATYVLYQTETRLNKDGQHYHIDSYYKLSDGEINVETIEEGVLDVVAVGDEHKTLGLDMMHHVAQWGADNWMVDESMFDLSTLRTGLQTHQDNYLGKDEFRGAEVYRIRDQNGLVLLLDMHYMPVNVLRGAVGPGTGEPVYDTLQLLSPSRISSSMWDMSVPAGFKMGALPAQP